MYLVSVLDFTQCLPQGAGTPPAMRGCMSWFPKTGGPGLRRGRIRWIQFAQSLLTVAHQPCAGCIRLVHSVSFIRLLGVSLVVIEWQTFSGSRHLAKYCADVVMSVPLPSAFKLLRMTASGNSHNLVLCILYVSVCVA